MSDRSSNPWPLLQGLARLRQRRYVLCGKMPNQEEQETAERYCCERRLERADNDVRRAAKAVLLFLVVNAAVTVLLYLLLDRLGFFLRLPEALHGFSLAHAGQWRFLFWLVVNALGFLVSLRSALIGAVRLYQHYAPEEVRRRCVFMPTCSEYAILAWKKYGAVIGSVKAFDRVYYRCRGNIYRIDYP